jgi:hypothetical protein
MFKFTIRELLLLTVVVAMGVGWWVRERQLNAEVAKSHEWRARTAALERFLNPEWRVEWHLQTNAITFYDTRRRGQVATIPIDISKPYSGHPLVDDVLAKWEEARRTNAVPNPSAHTTKPASE